MAHLEDHPILSKWSIPMVIVFVPQNGDVEPLKQMASF